MGVAASAEALVRAAQRGDLAAFNSLVQLHQQRVYNLCFRMLGQTEDAADATQDAFLHAYRAVGSFQGSAEGFQSWLLRIAANACYDQLRKKKRRPASSLDAPAGAEPESPIALADTVEDQGPGPEQRALNAETARRIQAGLNQLSPDQRLAVVLCDVQGHSYDQAAAIMAVELGTVKSRLSRGRAALRDYLTRYGELPPSGRRLTL